ncbi:DUF1120 domain-containing protein [Bordetella sp. 15P40C-2]|uniref:DUF1120 domain-containing protein n=1 Tax=Bordetella sp. 15P40C-2 TaxID=2572246 RepID=UPI001327AD1D|nr:DUF1120 domain-containing protein [Bordetella sp. 15P40C-2]MVW72525.1 DUF1120 domain-containing protein [Bordetella sp. 15P40C-2]
MKRTLLSLVFATALAAPMFASAASAVQMGVKGTIFPGACDISMPAGSTVNIGRYAVGALNKDKARIYFGGWPLNFQVTCQVPTIIGIKTIDERSGTAVTDATPDAPATGFGLGKAGNTNIGMYQFLFSQVTADGEKLRARTFAPGKSVPERSTYAVPGGTMKFLTEESQEQTPHRVYEGQVGMAVYLEKGSAFHITEETPIDGLVTFELVYE